MTDQTAFMRASGVVCLLLGTIVGCVPPTIGDRFTPECGSAWFRGLPVDLCANSLIMPTVLSLSLALGGAALLFKSFGK